MLIRKQSRVAQLEKKIDGIVSLLAASQHIQANSNSPLTPESSENAQIQQQLAQENEGPCPVGIPADVTPDFSSFELVPGFRLTAEEADGYLDSYRRNLSPKYPWVPLPSKTTSRALYAESRILFWAIMTVSAPQTSTVQKEVEKWFRRYFAEHIAVRQERSLDLLQAILVHMGG